MSIGVKTLFICALLWFLAMFLYRNITLGR